MTTLEKIARAICCPDQRCALGADDKRCGGAEGCKFQARAALLALREPSLDMAVAGCERLRAFYPDDPDANHRAASYAWVAMIDQALSEE